MSKLTSFSRFPPQQSFVWLLFITCLDSFEDHFPPVVEKQVLFSCLFPLFLFYHLFTFLFPQHLCSGSPFLPSLRALGRIAGIWVSPPPRATRTALLLLLLLLLLYSFGNIQYDEKYMPELFKTLPELQNKQNNKFLTISKITKIKNDKNTSFAQRPELGISAKWSARHSAAF